MASRAVPKRENETVAKAKFKKGSATKAKGKVSRKGRMGRGG